MSGVVETLMSTKVTHMTNKELEPVPQQGEEQQQEQKKKMTNKDSMSKLEIIKTVENQEDKILDLDSKDCLLEQPQMNMDKASISKRKGVAIERLEIPRVEESKTVAKADVEIIGLSIMCPGRPEISLSQPFISSPKACLFTLKEGTKYRLKFSFVVSNKVVTGLKYENTLWKTGVRIDRCTVKLGTFNPRETPYGYQLEEDTLPSGILVRGLYSARAKVIDSDGKCYMDINYHFDIQKRWPETST